jgi:hypothetical protein
MLGLWKNLGESMLPSLITFGVSLAVWLSHTRPDWLKGPTGSLQRSLYRSDPLPQRTDVCTHHCEMFSQRTHQRVAVKLAHTKTCDEDM